MATVMKVYTYQVLVDLYDQVPYTDALQGAADLQPKFDNGDSIYESLLSTLDSALNQDFTASHKYYSGKLRIFYSVEICPSGKHLPIR